MAKNIQKRNFTTIYIRTEYQAVFEDFCKYANRDPDFIAKRYKSKDSLISIGILTLIARYVKEQLDKEAEAGSGAEE